MDFLSTITFDTDDILLGAILVNGKYQLSIGSFYRDAVDTNTATIQDDVQAFVGDQGYFYDVDNYRETTIGFVFNDPRIFQLGFNTGVIKDPKTTEADYTFQAITSAKTGYLRADFNVSQLSITAVPLPATAPLFGAALLALGAAGYGMRRRVSAA